MPLSPYELAYVAVQSLSDISSINTDQVNVVSDKSSSLPSSTTTYFLWSFSTYIFEWWKYLGNFVIGWIILGRSSSSILFSTGPWYSWKWIFINLSNLLCWRTSKSYVNPSFGFWDEFRKYSRNNSNRHINQTRNNWKHSYRCFMLNRQNKHVQSPISRILRLFILVLRRNARNWS